MGGFCGVISKDDCLSDLFFGTDYHSHLGTHRGGLAMLNKGIFKREIHNIQNSPFRTKFQNVFSSFSGNAGIGIISDTDPQPLVMCSHLGTFAIVTVGLISNMAELEEEMFSRQKMQLQFSTTSGLIGATEVVSALIASQNTLLDGIRFAQSKIEGSCSMLVLTDSGKLYAARDRYGRTPIVIGKKAGSYIALQESCALPNLGYEYVRDLGPGETAELSPDGEVTVIPPGEKMAICSFLWIYYGYPASSYEERNVEMARYRCGGALARRNPIPADSVAGVPDSGISHALGYSQEASLRYARPFVKYTPTWARSFTPSDQRQREKIASMKLIPIPGLIKDKRLVFCDDSIVRGTQLSQQVRRLVEAGAKEMHMRIACPPLLYPCRFLNFSRSKNVYDLITRRYIRQVAGEQADVAQFADPDSENYAAMIEFIRQKLGFTSLVFQRVEDLVAAIGLPREKLCTYCWTGKDISMPCDCSHGCANCPSKCAAGKSV